ncbi:bifunctional adenosylcobinamide kinase/adenosylcobinamide-phosphate guanylyltransferase [uncultured Akkermansia sp.]|uniref:bifunctional adenosylcobinamide kinase/adenosylcobinamide-phosphate guanylyltransferase n=1 Tax=uncultured Akkermansia sp. TaxID=512294 RepID=UPI00261E2831|nr:bifunctional adenosylcobinamide kinase/adenosylcobinamide-phosphate guanylyltransferase [uncultured Akkermansia sp.]
MNATSPNTDANTARMTLVLGGIRSGKSQYAEQIAAGFGEKILYVATAEVWPGAGSMEYRVRKHRERRPESWLTLECPRHVASAVRESGLLDQVDGVILECVTLLASNTLYAQKDPTDYEPFQEALIEEIEALKKLIRQSPVPWVLVSSETGMGISQSDAETRHYCDGLGIANQLLARSADEVYFMVAGLPLTVKKG